MKVDCICRKKLWKLGISGNVQQAILGITGINVISQEIPGFF